MPDEPRRFHFPQGIPGFETYHDFQFVPAEEAQFAQLISVQENKVGFILMRPEAYFPEYLKGLDVDEESIKVLKVNEDMLVDVWVIVTLHSQDMAKTTVNLFAPILFNLAEGIGMQVILNDDRYLLRQPLFSQISPQSVKEGVGG